MHVGILTISMDDLSSLTRKGPRRVWKGYRNMRIPLEIFEDVRSFMEKRKIEFRAKQEGLEVDAMSQTTFHKEMKEKAREIIEEMLKERNISAPNMPTVRPVVQSTPVHRDMNSREKVVQYLKEHPNQVFRNTELSQILSIPSPTLREATRTISRNDGRFKLIEGRPNKIQYVP